MRAGGEALKRALDVALVVGTLPLVLPLVAAVALAVKIETPGPAVFRQTRVGRHGKPFRILKLRTMVVNAENMGAGHFFEKDDPRITRVGRLARRFSLDELPQVFNILAGDMSVVGPRPMLPMTVEEYPEQFERILTVRPGLTGLSQVSGRNSLTRGERLRLDQQYASTRTLGMDVEIIWRTVAVTLLGKGLRADQSREEVER
jgi:lipopolysaccharide/colanic/teichoic acid biosynthesis glycosyltransferase